jgi:uncharacterized RDD family membrane protein YckC
VQCAVEIQRELKAQNESVGEAQRMDFRIGINLGDVMIDDHDIFGEGVNIAARLQSLAQPGGILISGSVHDQVKNKLALGFNFMGHQQVKNITEQVPVFVVAHDAALASAGVATLGGISRAADKVTVKAPALLPLRFGAGVIDVLLATAAAFAIAVFLQGQMGPVFEVDAPFWFFATERVLSTDLPSTDIEGGGDVVRTTTRSLVERNYFGLIRQQYRRTDVELSGGTASSDSKGARQIRGDSSQTLVDPASKQPLVRPALSIFALALYLAILILTEGLLLAGFSPGKALLGLRVSNVQGGRPGLQRSALRNLAKIASVAIALIGVIMALWSKKRQMLHDQLAGCYVHDAK